MVSQTKLIRGLFIVSLLCYISSWFLPCLTFSTNGQASASLGWHLALMGITLGWANFQFEGYANIFYLYAMPGVWRQEWNKIRKYAFIGLALASQTFTLKKMQADSPVPSYLTGYEIGFYLWYLSFALILICSIIEPATKLFQKLTKKT